VVSGIAAMIAKYRLVPFCLLVIRFSRQRSRVAWQRLVRHIPDPADEARDLTILVIYFRPLGEVNDAEIEKTDRFRGHLLTFLFSLL